MLIVTCQYKNCNTLLYCIKMFLHSWFKFTDPQVLPGNLSSQDLSIPGEVDETVFKAITFTQFHSITLKLIILIFFSYIGNFVIVPLFWVGADF